MNRVTDIPAEIDGAAMPASVLENLSARFRLCGLSFLWISPDGNIAYNDSVGNPSFNAASVDWQQFVSDVRATVGVTTWTNSPGTIIAGFVHMRRRKMQGVFALAGRSSQHDEQTIASYAEMLEEMLHDQLRLNRQQQELESMSIELSGTYEELSLLYRVSSGMRFNRGMGEFFSHLCQDVLEVMGLRGIGVTLCDESSEPADPVFHGPMQLSPSQRQRLARELLPILRQRKSPLLVNNVAKDATFNWLASASQHLLAVPLQRQDNVLGCIFALDKQGDDFDTVDSKLLNSIANEAAIYLENFSLYEDSRGLMMGLMHSLVNAVDAKDAYTCGHSERVALLSRTLAQKAGFDDQFVDRVYLAGLLHDVGKIGVPENVLQKSGKLTPEEFELIKKHPDIGARILNDIRQIQDIIPGVLYHHERYDGKGYPKGLAGDEIPLMGRLICLADCFDAMTSSRTYRKAMPLEVALTEIKRCCGTQFDPALTDAFLSIPVEKLQELMMDHKRRTKQLLEAA